MAERYLVMDSVNGDRTITAEDFAEFFMRLSDDGYYINFSDELEVTANSPNDLTVLVEQGACMIRGRYYQLFDTEKQLTISTPDPSDPRIDRVVIRLDLASRTISAEMLDGTPAGSPSAPDLTRDATTWELSLAQVFVDANATQITSGDITDERDDPDLCGASVHRGCVSLRGDTMQGDLDFNNNNLVNVKRLFFEDRDENDVVIGLTESGATGEFLFSTYNANNLAFIDLFMQVDTTGTLKIDRVQGLTDANVIALGDPDGQGDKMIDTTGTAVRLMYDSQNYIFQSESATVFYFGGSQVHRFNSDGSKVGGSILVDGERLGMSPTDSPRSLVEDIMMNVKVNGRKVVSLDHRLRKIVDGSYTVFSSNPNIVVTEKEKDRFTLEGDGVCDLHIQGERYDKKGQYFVKMEQEKVKK